jgi:hypothetical protein
MSGGARVRAGRLPETPGADWRTLPADGRDGPLPHFPLSNPTDREWEVWEQLWATPQAVAWEADHLVWEAAAYVRVLVRAEGPRSSALLWTTVRQMSESLGLTASGLARNRWKIGTPEVADDAPAPVRKSARDRMKVVAPGE